MKIADLLTHTRHFDEVLHSGNEEESHPYSRCFRSVDYSGFTLGLAKW